MYPKKTIGKNLSLQLKSLYGQKKKNTACLLPGKLLTYTKKNKTGFINSLI